MPKRKKAPKGLQWHRGVLRTNVTIKGFGRLRESTGTRNEIQAIQYLANRRREIQRALVFAEGRPVRIFREAATRYLNEKEGTASGARAGFALKAANVDVGDMALHQIHTDTLMPFIRRRIEQGKSLGTVNREIGTIRTVLRRAHREWRDLETGLTWLALPPAIRLITPDEARTMGGTGSTRPKYPLAWDEQKLLFSELSGHLAQPCLFKVNTGTREQEVCSLKWEWEHYVPELEVSVFIIPGRFDPVGRGDGVKNREDRLVVLNSTALSVIEARRGKDDTFVFTKPNGEPFTRLYNTAWRNARVRASKKYKQELERECPVGFESVRVHDLKHTYGDRLRAAQVPLEYRKDLLGHKHDDITTHYSAPDVARLIEFSERVASAAIQKRPALTFVRKK